MSHPGNTLARYPDSTQAPQLSNTPALHRVNPPRARSTPAPHRAHNDPAPYQVQPPFRIEPITSQHCLGALPGAQKQKNRSELQLLCDWQLLRTPQSRIAAQKRSKNGHISSLKEPRRAPNRKKVAKIPSFLFFALGPIAATGQIPRKRAEYHDQQPKIRNKKGARYADASRKTNSAEIYASLAPYCS